MSRSSVSVRDATLADAPRLVEIWQDVIRGATAVEQITDLELVIKAAGASSEERLVVAEVEGQAVGAVFLRVTTMTPINLEPVVQAISPHVLPAYRRRGIGCLLMDQAVSFAEEVGVAHVATAAESNSREANRFMARLALTPRATMRVGATAGVRARLQAQRPVDASGRQLSRVLAARRSQRRARALD
ncbi:GNAT family N-acetyltransferase [Nocardioides salsibiostraticola]